MAFFPCIWRIAAISLFLLQLPLIIEHSARSVKKLSDPVRTHNIIGDGNCLFMSLSYVVTGRQTYLNNVRLKMLAHMIKIENALQPHIKTSVSDYLARSQMRNDRVWSTDIEILTATSLLNTDIYVYSKFGEAFRWSRFSQTMLNQFPPENETAVYIQNISGVHYDVVLDVAATDGHISDSNPCSLTAHTVEDMHRLKNQNIQYDIAEPGHLSKLSAKLDAINLEPLDVGGDGDCFFHAVSHQLYTTADHHMDIRLAGVDYI